MTELNVFIKSLEKDLKKDLNACSMPTTPNQLLRKVEEQMRQLGYDPKTMNKSQLALHL
jgi:hypothetical protein